MCEQSALSVLWMIDKQVGPTDWLEPSDCCSRIGQRRERSLFKPPADYTLPLQPFTHFQLGPVSNLFRILSLCFVELSVIVNPSLL